MPLPHACGCRCVTRACGYGGVIFLVVGRPCAHVDVMSSDFDDGGMLYYDRVGQERKKSGLESVFAPGSREKHACVRISGHHAILLP